MKSMSTNKPIYIKLKADNISSGLRTQLDIFSIEQKSRKLTKRTWVYSGDDTTLSNSGRSLYNGPGINSKQNWLEFVGFSVEDDCPIFQLYRQDQSSSKWKLSNWKQNKNTFGLDISLLNNMSFGFTYVSGGIVNEPIYSYTGCLSYFSFFLITILEDYLFDNDKFINEERSRKLKEILTEG